MKKTAIFLIVAVAVVLLLVGISALKKPASTQTAEVSNSDDKLNVNAESIEVVHFHATEQCVSCIAVGRLAKKTIEDKFPSELKNGTITFRDINLDLPENKETVAKYQASGSSLFVNAIAGGKDNIEEDATVWRLISNESQYISYFEKKLHNLMGI